jgi:hypothetical protein
VLALLVAVVVSTARVGDVVVSTARVGDGALDLCDSASGTGDDVAGVTERSLRAARKCPGCSTVLFDDDDAVC